MIFTQINDYANSEPVGFRKLKKIVPDGNNGWEERIFYATTKNVVDACTWLEEKYGKQKYSDTWWMVRGSIIMSEKIYIHYSLCV